MFWYSRDMKSDALSKLKESLMENNGLSNEVAIIVVEAAQETIKAEPYVTEETFMQVYEAVSYIEYEHKKSTRA